MAISGLPERLKRARDKRLWTQQQLADAAGVTRATVTKIESGQVQGQPRYTTIRALATALRVDARWLLHGDDVPVDDERPASEA